MNLRIQLELIYWALYSTVQLYLLSLCLTYILSPLMDPTVFTAQSSIIYSLPRSQYDKNINVMPFKALVAMILKVITSQDKDTNMVEN